MPDPSAAATSQPATAVPPNVPEAFSQRRANFWERMGAGFLDFVIVGILGGIVHGPPLGFFVALAYFAGDVDLERNYGGRGIAWFEGCAAGWTAGHISWSRSCGALAAAFPSVFSLSGLSLDRVGPRKAGLA